MNPPSSSPQKLTPEQLQSIAISIQNKKDQGATEATDPELAKLSQIYRIYSAKEPSGITSSHQTLSAQSDPLNNPVAQRIPDSDKKQPGHPENPQAPFLSPDNKQSNNQNQNKPAAPSSLSLSIPFNRNQLAELKYQILAYKLISRNLPLPDNLRQAILKTGLSQADTNNDPSLAGARKAVEVAYAFSVSTGAPSDGSFNKVANPYSLVKKRITPFAHASREQRLLIPGITPVGLDPVELKNEREKRIAARIKYRIDELENTPTTLSNNERILESSPSNPKLKAVIELKSLRLLEKQKNLRLELLKGMSRGTTLATAVDRASFRRMKKQTLREARMTEKMERQQRVEREKRHKQKRIDYLNKLIAHGRDMMAWHKTIQQRRQKLARSIINFHGVAEKEEQKRIERLSKQRLQALKADDEEAYLKLLDQAKDTRITHLLQQTDQYLNSLSTAVMSQRSESGATFVPLEEGKKLDYYEISHQIKEEVNYQPRMLIGGSLKEYQLKGLEWLASLYNNGLNGILADEMGLGKTIQTISLLTYLVETKKQTGPFLIIVPLSTIGNWSLEFEKWAPGLVKVVYKGSPPVRRQIQFSEIRHGNFNALLTTFEYIIKDRPLLSKIKWVYMIIDEGHRLKNANSKLVSTLIQYYHSRHRLILTGTPLQNNLPELWALLNFVLPKVFSSVKSFDEWFNTPFANTAGQERIELNEEEKLLIIKRLHKILRPFILRRLKKDVEAELPDKVETVIRCKLSALQQRLYHHMTKHGMLFTAVEGSSKKSGIKGLNNTIMQLRKICNHPFVFDEVEHVVNPTKLSNELLYRTSGKFELLDRILPKFFATNHRILMFFQMTAVMDIMEDFLHLKGYRYLRLDGSTKSEERAEMLKVFNAPNSPYFMFLLSTRAGGLGLNLQSADTVIIFDSDWNPHQDLQAQDRAHRIGQTKEVRILRLITMKSVEEQILSRAQFKLDIDGKVIQAGKFDNKSTAEEREAYLRSLIENDNDETNDVEENEELDDDELNEILSRSDEELVIFKKIDEERKKKDDREWRELGNSGPRPARLIEDHELPQIYLQEEIDVDSEDELERGRGQRNRTEVRYDDGLTEEQWLNALEDEEVDMEEVIRKKQERRRKRIERRERERNVETEPDEDSRTPKSKGRRRKREDSVDSEIVPVEDEKVLLGETPKKRGRKKKTSEVGTPSSVKSRGRKRKMVEPDPLSPNSRKELTRICKGSFKAVEDCLAEDGRPRATLFLQLPSKRIYPNYYLEIKQPIAMNMIKDKILSGRYTTVEEFCSDFMLMFNNARQFNEEGSWVYEDANEMQRSFEKALEELKPQRQQQEMEEVLTEGEEVHVQKLKIRLKPFSGDQHNKKRQKVSESEEDPFDESDKEIQIEPRDDFFRSEDDEE